MGKPGSFAVNSPIQLGTVTKKRKSLTSTTTESSRPIIYTDSVAQALENLGKELNDSNVISDIAPFPPARKPKLASEFTPAAIDGSEELHIGFTPDAANVDMTLEKSKEIPIEVPKGAQVPEPYANVTFPTSLTANNQMCAEFGALPSKTQAQPSSVNFQDLVKMAMQSLSNASLGSSHPPVYPDDHLLLILKQLLFVGKHMLLFRNASQGPSEEVVALIKKVYSLQNGLKDISAKKDADILEKDNLISSLQKEITSIAAKRDEIISEKDKIATSLADELNAKQMLERKIKKLETDLESSSTLKEDVERTTKENAELIKRNAELIEENELLSTQLQRKSSLLDSSNNIIMDANDKVANFLNVALSRIKDECYEDALFIAYADNIRKCPDLDFPSLMAINDRCKRKFSLKLKKDIETLKREFPEFERIKAEEWLTFDDASSDEESQPEDKGDGDNDDDGGEHNDGIGNNGHRGKDDDDDDRHDDHGGGESSEANPPSQPHDKNGTGDANQAPPAQDVEAASATSSQQKGPSGMGSAPQSQKPAERKTPPPPVPSPQLKRVPKYYYDTLLEKKQMKIDELNREMDKDLKDYNCLFKKYHDLAGSALKLGQFKEQVVSPWMKKARLHRESFWRKTPN